jgi:hypothetical protein
VEPSSVRGYHVTDHAFDTPSDRENAAAKPLDRPMMPSITGPVGLMAAYSALIRGASRVFLVDRHEDRLRLAESIGVIPIDDSAERAVDQILAHT